MKQIIVDIKIKLKNLLNVIYKISCHYIISYLEMNILKENIDVPLNFGNSKNISTKYIKYDHRNKD